MKASLRKTVETLNNQRQERNLARQAIRDSENLLHEIDNARDHIERVYRVQVVPNALGFVLHSITSTRSVAEDSALALDFLLWRLSSLKCEVEVDQFFPTCYFRSGFIWDSHQENTETYRTLRNFIEKHLIKCDPSATKESAHNSWATRCYHEIKSFQSYDAPDFRIFLLKSLKTIQDRTAANCRANSNKSDSEGSPTSTSELATSTTNTSVSPQITPSSSDTQLAKSPSLRSCRSTKLKFKLKNAFTLRLNKRKEESSNFGPGDSTSGKMCTRTKALLNRYSGVVPDTKANK
jgi:hypothetical protein